VVVIANSGVAPAAGVVELVPSSGKPTRVRVSVPPDASIRVAESLRRAVAWIGAIVDMDAGAVAVEQETDGLAGGATTPCATSGSDHWYFAAGATLINAGVELTLLNPYASDSVVDLSFTTNQGPEAPEEFQGLVVPANGMLNVDLGSHLRRRQAIATTVTARTGRVVAWKTDWVKTPRRGSTLLGTRAANNPLADPAFPIAGATVALGAPSAGTQWTWPDGYAGNGIDERYLLYNPGARSADVRLSLGLDQGVAEPFELSVGPYQVVSVVSEQQARIPAGVAHSAVLQSLNGVPIVAERTVVASEPSPWTGLGEMVGDRVAAERWLLASGRPNRAHAAYVIIYNPGYTPVQVAIDGLSASTQVPLERSGAIRVPPLRRVSVPLPVLRRGSEPVVVIAGAPVFVESDVYARGGNPGVGLSPGVPLSP
jgi:hypothetical protein